NCGTVELLSTCRVVTGVPAALAEPAAPAAGAPAAAVAGAEVLAPAATGAELIGAAAAELCAGDWEAAVPATVVEDWVSVVATVEESSLLVIDQSAQAPKSTATAIKIMAKPRMGSPPAAGPGVGVGSCGEFCMSEVMVISL